jgi:group I intron endonuclease
MLISKSLIKYGYSNFTLEILEYCQASEVVQREQHYMDLLKPQYNILQKAGSLLGFKHSKETIAKIKNLTPEKQAKRLEHADARHDSLVPRLRVPRILKRLHSSPEHKEHLNRLNLLQSKKVEVLDSQNNETTIYSSLSEAAIAIGVAQGSISNAFKRRGDSTV